MVNRTMLLLGTTGFVDAEGEVGRESVPDITTTDGIAHLRHDGDEIGNAGLLGFVCGTSQCAQLVRCQSRFDDRVDEQRIVIPS